MNIYVGNIAQDVSEEELTNLFTEYGKVSSAKILRDMFTQESRGFGLLKCPVRQTARKQLRI